jgi:uncharacterized protein (DUF1697 family)
MSRYVALLRGINVGGNNLIKMIDLAACFRALGFSDVATYIQSGNVVFTAAESGAEKLTRRIEAALDATFGGAAEHISKSSRTPALRAGAASVFLRSRKQMHDIVARAPAGFGAQPARYRYDVIFLRPPFSAAAAMKSVPTRPGVDQACGGAGVLYFSRLISKASSSRLGKIASMPIYKSMTIRNWNTTTALLHMLEVG